MGFYEPIPIIFKLIKVVVTGLLTDASLLTSFDHIIFNTVPTGHTIRLLQLPSAWSSFIENNPDGVSCLGPMVGLEKQREQYAHAVEALREDAFSSYAWRRALLSLPKHQQAWLSYCYGFDVDY
ncbi:hypothetical protein HV237_20920 [Citrobacter sp. RHBSTW-00570]|nr:hypothetical protein [Escherichia coli]QLV70243.1 hypothetical protein HV237_20920 [Citrobacter sp. RHBSTW-00570]HCL6633959.1 hypothetical protein [Citrobacter freundii]HED2420906.1 hypothetical protein [Citrobacter freundii]HED3098344.1 hypothetical protein [Citrobacter freundii]